MPTTAAVRAGTLATLRGEGHRKALWLFLWITIAHWVEHVVQAIQIWVLGWPGTLAGGLLGMLLPWQRHQEWLHYGYAVGMLVGLVMLRPPFVGRARAWWTAALVIQFWHHIEHLLLLMQALLQQFLFGATVPTSILQVLVPRVQLHNVYNAMVFVPMVIGMYLHLRPNRAEGAAMTCGCASN